MNGTTKTTPNMANKMWDDTVASMKGMAQKVEQTNDKIAQMVKDVTENTVKALVNNYTNHAGMYARFGKDGWQALCDFTIEAFGKDGEQLVARAYDRICAKYSDPRERERAQISFTQWRLYHIGQAMASMAVERDQLLAEVAKIESTKTPSES